MPRVHFSKIALAAILASSAGILHAQDAADRATSAQVASEREVPVEDAKPRQRVEVDIQPSAVLNAPGAGLFVGAITLSGLTALHPADFADLIAERIGRTLSSQELSALADAVSARMRARGYPLGLARIEPQRLANGVLIVHVNEGTIDEVRFDGARHYGVARALAPLQSGLPVTLAEVERRLLLAGDIDGVRIQQSRFVREGEKGILLVRVSHARVRGFAGLSNQGTMPVGPDQVRLQAEFNGVLTSDDSLTLSYSATPFEPGELQFGFARYEKRISPGGTELSLSGSASTGRPGAYLEALNIRNRSWFVAAGALQPLVRRRKASYWLEGELGIRNLAQWRGSMRTRQDRLAVGRLTVYGYTDFAGGRLRTSATFSQGLGIFDATRAGDALASRRDADGTFSAMNLWADWTSELGSNFSLRMAAQGQVSSQPLLISEELGLGGTSFLRGYDWGERTGDEGAIGMAELRYSLKDPLQLINRAQVYAFIDAGTLSNRATGFGGGSLASTGGGVRLDITLRLGLNLEVAVPISGPRYDTSDRMPKVNFSIARSF